MTAAPPADELAQVPAVVFCGGRGRRLGSLGRARPKTLLEVHGRPILWYLLGSLHLAGFRRFVLPLGWRGGDVRRFLDETPGLPATTIEAIDTGKDAHLADRLGAVVPALGGADACLVVNGDTLIDAELRPRYRDFRGIECDGLMLTVRAPTPFGLVVSEGGQALHFVRSSIVDSYAIQHEGSARPAHVYSGVTFLRRDPLERWLAKRSRSDEDSFEQDYYGQLCRGGRMESRDLGGFWYCIDTSKDLDGTTKPAVSQSILDLRRRIESLGSAAPRRPSEVDPGPHP